MNVASQEQFADAVPGSPNRHAAPSLFVSSTLLTWSTETPERFGRDFQINDTVYRRLDPEYYLWLRSRMVIAKKAAAAGQVGAAAFEELRLRFNAVHEWAIEHLGEEKLLAALQNFNPAGYQPPVAENDWGRSTAPTVRKSATARISSEAMAAVEEISGRALSLGWNRERLYGVGGSGAFDPRRGLVCYLKPGDRIGELTAQSIEIIRPLPMEVRLRFYNPDVEQPWVRKVVMPGGADG